MKAFLTAILDDAEDKLRKERESRTAKVDKRRSTRERSVSDADHGNTTEARSNEASNSSPALPIITLSHSGNVSPIKSHKNGLLDPQSSGSAKGRKTLEPFMGLKFKFPKSADILKEVDSEMISPTSPTSSRSSGLLKQLRPANSLDVELIAPSSGRNILSEFGEPTFPEVGVHMFSQVYQDYFHGEPHFLFVGKNTSIGLEKRIVAVREVSLTKLQFLVFSEAGIQATSLEFDLDETRELTQLFMNVPGLTPTITWVSVSSTRTELPVLLLSLECRLGFSRRITVGVFCNSGGQTEEHSSGNSGTPAFFNFMKTLAGKKVALKDWPHFNGGMHMLDVSEIYYACWRGFEIVFHVAPDLTTQLQRQLIANDKVVIHFAEKGPVLQDFRGIINSIGIVVRAYSTKEDVDRFCNMFKSVWEKESCASGGQVQRGWHMGVFFRDRLPSFNPIACSDLVVDDSDMRDLVFANIVNGNFSVLKSPHYSRRFSTVFAQEIDNLIERYFE